MALIWFIVLIPMFARLELHTGRAGHADTHVARGSAGSGLVTDPQRLVNGDRTSRRKEKR